MASLAIVTGAAHGFGRSIALEAAAKLPGLASLVLLSRDPAALEQTAAECRAAAADRAASVDVRTGAFDMAPPEQLPARLRAVFDQLDATRFARVLLVCNAGSLGPLDLMQNVRDFEAVRGAFDLNVTATAVLCSIALDTFRTGALTLVNVSSLAAVKPFASWGVYCAGKAARDMLFRAIAEEANETAGGGRQLTTLNYAPGPMDTDMQRDIRDHSQHAPTREAYTRMKDQGQLVDPAASAAKLVKLLVDDSFASGSHVDYFDI
eukprot:TRINITY_DN1224_c0_g1_i3.p1 TRINITY_DN1224_c0_g1~~TRINITY_DN1224_c0_g1_i3.p1  ORF type:complete len:264 (-),score=97.14 TRINITY_DN1224_c0_g1_i3:177-968(-)